MNRFLVPESRRRVKVFEILNPEIIHATALIRNYLKLRWSQI